MDARIRHYPPDVFPSFWRGIDELLAEDRLKAPVLLLDETVPKDDELSGWVKRNEDALIMPMDEAQQNAVAAILGTFPNLINPNKSRSMGDPFFIALAQVNGLILVTGEKNRGNPNKPKIPDVCDALSIPCLNILELIRREGWRF
ncbi:hypothetical protein MishRS11D_28480 [Methylomagnum ishizawai]|nr:hypothetical protein MishRS11D_28480 [Methylomagnum ishizawai]